VKPQLPMFLTSWVDKTSAQCMYTMTQTRTWSVPHLQVGCWYIECGRTICPVEEEEVKNACDKADSKGVEQGSDHVNLLEEVNEVDLALLPEKERNRILNQRTKDAKKATEKVDKDAQKAKDKQDREAKKGERAGRSKSKAPLLIEASTTTPLENPCKRDASAAQLSVSRLQQITSPALMDSAGGAFHVEEFFFSGSLLSTDAYFVQQQAFPKEWVDMVAFLEKVISFSC
jgi:hypothetical protein